MQRIIFLAFVLMINATTFAANQVYLLGLRIQPALNTSYFTFILTQKTTGKVVYYRQENKLIVELANTYKHFNFKNVQLKGSNVATLTSEDTPKTVRFIFSLKNEVDWKINFVPSPTPEVVMLRLSLSSVDKTQTVKDTFAKSLAVVTASPVITQTSTEKKMINVVIDAGHGGKDPGAIGKKGSQEKEIVLAIAKRIAIEINRSNNMRAYLTREGDYFVPLRTRLALARQKNADLFIAIHADAYFDKHATGASIYALSQHGATTEAARWLARRENYSELDGVELDGLKDKSPLLRYVLIDLAQTATIRSSLRLGTYMLDSLDDISSLHFQHVAQAPFVVLKSPDIPSVLIETGFITNPYEEARLTNVAYQERLALAILKGIQKYVAKAT